MRKLKRQSQVLTSPQNIYDYDYHAADGYYPAIFRNGSLKCLNQCREDFAMEYFCFIFVNKNSVSPGETVRLAECGGGVALVETFLFKEQSQ